MTDFILFFISFFLVTVSSVLFMFGLKEQKPAHNALYFILILISLVILTFEVLSLFKAITPEGVLAINLLFFAVAAILWSFLKRPLILIKKTEVFLINIFRALKSDKILMVLAGLFIFSCIIGLLYVLFIPTNNGDSHGYKMARVAFWTSYACLDHFPAIDLRQAVFPINFELILLWPYVFLKSDYLALFPAFLSYFGCLGVVGVFLRDLKISYKRILWVLLILGSLPILLIESTSTQSDLFIGFLLFTSFYLFYYSVKNNKKLPVIFSALAYAIALGAKSTAILFIPAFVVVFFLLAMKVRRYQYLYIYIGYFIPLFMLLSAYNYILNFHSFGNPFGPSVFIGDHVRPGLPAFLSSISLYVIYFADFSGISFIKEFNPHILEILSGLINIKNGLTMGEFTGLNYKIEENLSAFGLLGYILIIPAIICAIFKLPRSRGKAFYLRVCGLFFLVFLIILAAVMGFSVWFYRFFTTVIVLSAPVLIFSYSKKKTIYKIIITLIAGFNFIAIPLFNESKPFHKIVQLATEFNSFEKFRMDIRMRSSKGFKYIYLYNLLNLASVHIADNAKVGVIYSRRDLIYPLCEINPGWKVYPVIYEKLLEEKNFDDYDYIIITSPAQAIRILDKNVVFDYYYDKKLKKIIFNKNIEELAKTVYTNREDQFAYSLDDKPIYRLSLIEEEKFSKYYEKIYDYSVKENPNLSSDIVIKIFKRKNIS